MLKIGSSASEKIINNHYDISSLVNMAKKIIALTTTLLCSGIPHASTAELHTLNTVLTAAHDVIASVTLGLKAASISETSLLKALNTSVATSPKK